MTYVSPNRGLRLHHLRLQGRLATGKRYEVSFETEDQAWRPLSVIAGPSQTGKTTVAEFILYNLGAADHPQHPEVLSSVSSSILDVDLAGAPATIERAAIGDSSSYASLWWAGRDDLVSAAEERLSTDTSADPSLSQTILMACELDHIELPVAPRKGESGVQRLSVRDLFRVMWLPNERLDNKSLVYEQGNYMVRQKFIQTIEVMFGVHDAGAAAEQAQLQAATVAATNAQREAEALRRLVTSEYPAGTFELGTELASATADRDTAQQAVRDMDNAQSSQEDRTIELRAQHARASATAAAASVRVRDRVSLLARLSALLEQYADDLRKLNFLSQAEELFDPLRVVACPACLSPIDSPRLQAGTCSLCLTRIGDAEAIQELTLGGASSNDQAAGATEQALIEAEARSMRVRLRELKDYHERLATDLLGLQRNEAAAQSRAARAAYAVDQLVELPRPFMAARDAFLRQAEEALIRRRQAQAGLRMWARVTAAEDRAATLVAQATRLRAARKEANQRASRAEIVTALSGRFAKILADLGYPKLSNAYLDTDLVPHLRGLPYTSASSGGLTLVSIAWYLALWEVAHELNAKAPGLLIIDSPQKNLGHAADPTDPDFADSQLVENFYRHVLNWLEGDGRGAQLIVIDNSPPESVANHVVVHYTRDAEHPPYGLIDDAPT